MWQGSHALITPNIAAGPLNGGMHAVDRIVEERAREGGPIRVAMVGAGALARVIALQMATDLPDVSLVAIADQDLNAARSVYAAAGMRVPLVIESPFGLRAAIEAGECVVTQDWRLLCESDEIDAIIEAVAAPTHAVDVIQLASEAGKHVIPTSLEAGDGALESAQQQPAGRIELVPVEVDSTNFFDIARSGDERAPAAREEDERHQRPAARA